MRMHVLKWSGNRDVVWKKVMMFYEKCKIKFQNCFTECNVARNGWRMGPMRKEIESNSVLDPTVETHSGGFSSERKTFKRSGENGFTFLKSTLTVITFAAFFCTYFSPLQVFTAISHYWATFNGDRAICNMQYAKCNVFDQGKKSMVSKLF